MIPKKIKVKVIANSKENSIQKIGEKSYKIKVTSPRKDNKANLALMELLADFFCISKSRIIIKKGHKSPNKLIEFF
ncbi:MAG: hypothetical protein GF335_01760 [Candidatus Moranbacteria bacterium]|nr:hypothetical protein [Candidatus Moranbacteria bacterium]